MHAFRQAIGDLRHQHSRRFAGPSRNDPDMIREWEAGYSMVLGIKRSSEENPLMFWVRRSTTAW